MYPSPKVRCSLQGKALNAVFSTIIYDQGQWREFSCGQCKANTSWTFKSFFAGSSGFASHYFAEHGTRVTLAAVLTLCESRVVSDKDLGIMRQAADKAPDEIGELIGGPEQTKLDQPVYKMFNEEAMKRADEKKEEDKARKRQQSSIGLADRESSGKMPRVEQEDDESIFGSEEGECQ